MRLACSTATFPEDRRQIAIAKVGWAGFPGVEIALDEGALPEADEIREPLLANELQLAALRAGSLPADVLSEGGLEALAKTGRAAALARALDGSLLVVEAPTEGSLPEFARTLHLLDRALGNTEVDLCLVNAPGTLLADLASFKALWATGLPARVGIALDPARALLAGLDPLNLDALPELPRHVYLTDARDGKPVPPGEGDLNIEGLAEALKVRGYSGAVSLLLENADPWAVEPVAKETREQAEVWFG